MPTMIQRFECETCHEVHSEESAAVACSLGHPTADGGTPLSPSVTTLDLWECDGEGCQEAFDSQWYAQQCEAEHEEADAKGRQGVGVGGQR